MNVHSYSQRLRAEPRPGDYTMSFILWLHPALNWTSHYCSTSFLRWKKKRTLTFFREVFTPSSRLEFFVNLNLLGVKVGPYTYRLCPVSFILPVRPRIQPSQNPALLYCVTRTLSLMIRPASFRGWFKFGLLQCLLVSSLQGLLLLWIPVAFIACVSQFCVCGLFIYFCFCLFWPACSVFSLSSHTSLVSELSRALCPGRGRVAF